MKQIAILASGNGSNAEAIVHHFRATGEAEVAMIITNKPQAGVIQRAERLGVPCHYFTNAELREGTRPIALMKEHGVELIILAGYLCLITPIYIMEYPERIMRITRVIGHDRLTLSAYIDHVLTHHFNQCEDAIKSLYARNYNSVF